MMDEKTYLNIVASLGCMKCGAHSVEIHHVRRFAGMGQRASNWLTIPLCPSCHRTGRDSIHQNTTDEGKLLAKTIQAVAQKLAADRNPF